MHYERIIEGNFEKKYQTFMRNMNEICEKKFKKMNFSILKSAIRKQASKQAKQSDQPFQKLVHSCSINQSISKLSCHSYSINLSVAIPEPAFIHK